MKYLLTFKPLKHFFFGNNKTFTDDYLAISEYFPQNTQLLGALRLFIAEQQKLMKVYKKGKWCDKPKELKKLTGTATSNDFIKNSDLGMIQNLSQMFMVNSKLTNAYFPTPFDIKISDKEIEYYKLSSLDKEYYLKNYDAKHYQGKYLGDKTFWKNYVSSQYISLDNVEQYDYEVIEKENEKIVKGFFVKHSQVGIELENKQTVKDENDNGKFYSKIDYQLRDGFLFACLVELQEEIIQDGIIQIGAESSLFDLKVIPYEDTQLEDHPIVSQLFTKPESADKIICISDTILDSTDDFNSKFTIVPYYKNFAMIKADEQSFVKNTSKYKNNKRFKGKTVPKRVIPTGTVSFQKENQLPKEQNIGAYIKMGYNQFISVKN